jgi:predicted glycogen debranching enzyme
MDTPLDVSALPFDEMVGREWLATNALGGYASSTVPSLNTRKYHGLLVAAMAPPVRRMVLLSRVEETLTHDGWPFALASNEYPGTVHPEGYRLLRAFAHEPFPRWAYQGDGWALEKSLHLVRGQNTVCLAYTLLGGDKPLDLEVRPLFALRGIHDLMYQWQGRLTVEAAPPLWMGRTSANGHAHRIPPTGRTPEVFFAHDGTFESQPSWYFNTIYRREQERGYGGLEDLWMPGPVRFKLSPGKTVYFACSTDPIDLDGLVEQVRDRQALVDALQPSKTVNPAAGRAADAGPAQADAAYAALCRAAGQYVAPISKDSTGDDVIAVIARYPWSAPAGRDAMIAFGGLFLATGRHAEGRALLLSMATTLKNGLMPSEFPEDGGDPVYQGADVSLWFVHAVHQYLRQTGDETTVRKHLYRTVVAIIEQYRNGTDLGIVADADGLITTHEPGVGTTWMDARVGDWVVTPRSGRPVEVQALWYNALCVAANLSDQFGDAGRAAELTALAASVKEAFNRRFWNPEWVCCFDVVGDDWQDASIRPNQILAASLPFPVLELDRHELVLEWVQSALLTPYGVRTLASDDPNFQPRYAGNVVARDRAYHNGAAFPWLLGPLVTTYIRVRGRGRQARAEAAALLRPCLDYLTGQGLGQLSELFDGTDPQLPGGAPASAAAVGEVLRCYVEDLMDEQPAAPAPALKLSLGDLSGVAPAPPAPRT